MADISIPKGNFESIVYPFRLEGAAIIFTSSLQLQNQFYTIEVVLSPPVSFPELVDKDKLFFMRLMGGIMNAGVLVPKLINDDQAEQPTFRLGGGLGGIFF